MGQLLKTAFRILKSWCENIQGYSDIQSGLYTGITQGLKTNLMPGSCLRFGICYTIPGLYV